MAIRLADRPARLGWWPWPRQIKANRAQVADLNTFGIQSTLSPHHRDYASYLLAYKTVPYVRSCVAVIAFSCANVKYALTSIDKSDSDETEDESIKSPLLDLLAKPNPYQTGFELRELIFTDLELTGNAFVSLEAQTSGGIPTELYRLQPDHVTILGDPKAGIRGYVYNANGMRIMYGPDEVWHQKLPHPFDPLYGMGTIEAMETRADSAKAMAEHEARFWQSGAKITGILTTDGPVDQTLFDRLKKSYRDFLRNSGFSTLILEAGLKYQPVTEGLASLGLLEIHHMSRDEILTMFGVPPTKVGIIESANYKAQAADEYFWTTVIDPKLTRNEQAMQSMVDLFHPGQGLCLRYDRLTFDDDSEQANVAKTMAESLTFTINELRAYQGKEPVKSGNVILIGNRPPVAFDPETGEATVLGGPAPGVISVDENGQPIPPIIMQPPAPKVGTPTPPPTAAEGPILAAKSLDIDYDRLADAVASRLHTKAAVTEQQRALFLASKKVIDEKAAQVHTPALMHAFAEQEQRVKDALKRDGAR